MAGRVPKWSSLVAIADMEVDQWHRRCVDLPSSFCRLGICGALGMSGDVGRKKPGEGVGQWRRTQENVNGPNSEELGPVAEDRGFEPLRDVTPARVPGV